MRNPFLFYRAFVSFTEVPYWAIVAQRNCTVAAKISGKCFRIFIWRIPNRTQISPWVPFVYRRIRAVSGTRIVQFHTCCENTKRSSSGLSIRFRIHAVSRKQNFHHALRRSSSHGTHEPKRNRAQLTVRIPVLINQMDADKLLADSSSIVRT